MESQHTDSSEAVLEAYIVSSSQDESQDEFSRFLNETLELGINTVERTPPNKTLSQINYRHTSISKNAAEPIPGPSGVRRALFSEAEDESPAASSSQIRSTLLSQTTLHTFFSQANKRTKENQEREGEPKTKKKKLTQKTKNKDSTPTQKTKAVPQRRAPKVRGDSGIEEDDQNVSSPTMDGDNSNASNESDDVEEGSDDESIGTVDSFSIHRMIPSRLRSEFKKESAPEERLIELVMNEVNSKYKNKAIHFQKRVPPAESDFAPQPTSSEEIRTQLFGFSTLAYVQQTQKQDPILHHLGIYENVSQVNKIIFFYRHEEIFAITIGQTWQAVQKYCCYKFPCIIARRLTSADGNLQQKLKPMTGINRTTTATKKNVALYDKLKNIRLNETKEIRPDASIYKLKGFSAPKRKASRRKVRGKDKMLIQLKCVRILKKMTLKYLPELLDHFSKICNHEATFTTNGETEADMDSFPVLRPMSITDKGLADEELRKLIFNFLHNSNSYKLQQFDVVDKHIDDYSLATDFKLRYRTKGVGDIIAEFPSCPTILQVFTALRQNCQKLIDNCQTFCPKFETRLKTNVILEYKTNGKLKEDKLMNMLEGELNLNGVDCWKAMGMWCSIQEEYFYQIHKEFLDLLRKPGEKILVTSGDPAELPLRWTNDMKSVSDYVSSFKEVSGYFLPPPPPSPQPEEHDESQPGSSQESNEVEVELLSSGIRHLNWFDMLHVHRNETDQRLSIYIYYIFDRFDPSIRDASTRISQSLDKLFKHPYSTDQDATWANLTLSQSANIAGVETMLEKFYDHHSTSKEFHDFFPTLDTFLHHVTEKNNVSIVVAFATNVQRVETQGPMARFLVRLPSEDELVRVKSLEHEKNLQQTFNTTNIRELVLKHLDQTCLNTIASELSGHEQSHLPIANILLNLLEGKGYCTSCESPDKPISGKLLKLRSHKDFALFKEANLNKEIFLLVQRHFLTQFPGIVHKLECLEMFENVNNKMLSLKIAEILVDQPQGE